ncbi:hypothetical protein B296_00002924 [Ensete ventricosum]|uniref:Uncharacterized protein n=1 Tax=Ensete ventricosum TaxID=4639 RepID=A0A427B377_ENSVE|nr:hypothetical protein B296_00002924 [Ensete ventricosum]
MGRRNRPPAKNRSRATDRVGEPGKSTRDETGFSLFFSFFSSLFFFFPQLTAYDRNRPSTVDFDGTAR